MDCSKVPNSRIDPPVNNTCYCNVGYIWNKDLSQCICPSYMYSLGGFCVCLDNYYFNNGTCVVNCTSIPNFLDYNPQDNQTCLCKDSFYYTTNKTHGGCQLNCTNITNTILEDDFQTCICREHTVW